MRERYRGAAAGAPLPIKIRRGGQELSLDGKLQFGPGEIVIEEDPSASPKAVRIRNGILRGTTGP
jgi:hypothetical protein